MTDEPQATLRRLEQRLSDASAAAERLIAETARKRPPPAGWQAPGQERPGPGEGRAPELELLHACARLLDELVPTEVAERLAAALRELFLAVRALIDSYAERLERPARTNNDRAKDVPIE